MPITHKLNKLQRVLETRAAGVVSAEDLARHLEMEERDGLLAVDELFDARGATTNLTSDQVRTFVRRTEDLARSGRFGALAFVTDDKVAFGMARMYQLLCDDKPVSIGVFHDVDSATRWLAESPRWDAHLDNSENSAMTTETTLETMEVEVPPVMAATLTTTCDSRPEAIAQATGRAMQAVTSFIGRHFLTVAGPPRTIYTSYGATTTTLMVAIPIVQAASQWSDDDVKVVPISGAHAIRFLHRGPYEGLRETYGSIERWLRERGGLKTDADWLNYFPMWEEYLNDPTTTPPADLVTQIYFTLRSPEAPVSAAT